MDSVFDRFSSYADSLSHAGVAWFILVIGVILAYFIGNINPAILLGRIYGVGDIRSHGSGNAGTTNVLRTLGKKAGAITLLIDVLKGVIPTVIALLAVNQAYAMLVALAVVVGHMWPAAHGFRGGKGVATTLGVLLAIDFRFALCLLAIFIILVAIFRMVSLGVICACVLAIPMGLFFGPWHAIFIGIIAILIIYKHRSNIVRIVKGTENKLSFGSKDKQ
ncbi:MAG: glycerol-3-phosphate 1-O-acyltransferase PlsY [Clostridiales Family XIII bacterium]|jgi:glycerol-3-phosphate acyltransferase PlsY|nr:glycerol-3-phosphate 1-O-acyltransferase PlsY [Clostridiales Family XIII bacterium]